MAEPTVRDRVWAAALRLGVEDRAGDRMDGFTVQDVLLEAPGLDDSHHRTAKRTLNSMAELGWIRHVPGSPKYRPEARGPFTGWFPTNQYWADDRTRQRQLAKMARDLGSVDSMFPLEFWIDAVEEHVKEEAVQRWREEAASPN